MRNRATALWRNVPTVSAKFLLILIPILVLTTVTFSSIFFYFKYEELKARERERIGAIAEFNAVALSASLWAFDVAATRNIIQAISVNREVRCIEVTDDLAGIRSAWPPGARQSGCPPEAGEETARRDIEAGNQRLGSITLAFTHELTREQIRAEIINTLWLLALVLGGTVVTALAAHRITIGVALDKLIQSIHLADVEHVRHPVDWNSTDELGRVITAYNAMLARLTREENALRLSEERLNLAITATRSAVWDHDLVSGDYWWSAEFPQILGYQAADLAMTARTWEKVVHADDLDRVKDAARRHLNGETPTFSAIYRMHAKDGGLRWIEDKATAIRDAGGRAIRMTGTMSDVSERVRAEEAFARERNVLQITLDNVEQGVIMVDRDLRLVLSNRRAAELLNLPAEFLSAGPSYLELLRRQCASGDLDDGVDPDTDPASPLMATQAAVVFKRRRPDGMIIEVRSNPLLQGGFVRTFTDVTVEARSTEEVFNTMQALERAYGELKETQASLVQAEKMASLALLVAGMAHEINTPVGIAYGCATHLSGRTRAMTQALDAGTLRKSDLLAYAETALEAGRLIDQNLTRAAELIQSFKLVAIDQTSRERRRFDLKAYLNEVVTSLKPQLRSTHHTVIVEAEPGIAIDSYPGALSQILTNLMMNALTHAFEDQAEGHIRIEARLIGEEREDAELIVQDDGQGIPPENLSRVFEPFFTTKRGSGGSGLGLHIVFNLVTQSLGGRITVDSAPGRGTTFNIRLPRVAPVRPDPQAFEPVARTSDGGAGK